MGKNNRQRRAAKRRDRTRWQGTGPPHHSAHLGERDLVEILLFDAAEAAEHKSEDQLEAALDRVAAIEARGGGDRSLVGRAMTSILVAALRSAWNGGWQPADIVRAATKRLGSAPARLAGEVIAAEAGTSAGSGVAVPESWAAQLQQVAAAPVVEPRWTDQQDLRAGVALLGMLIHLPDLPHLMPPPSEWGRGRPVSVPAPGSVDSRMLAKVRALLAKAESTDFEDEASALTAKAQELMARHAIDQAMLRGRDDPGAVPCGRRIGISDPYALGKAMLLSSVARANRCRTVWMEGYGFSTLFGFSTDTDIVDVLYTSLLVQAIRAMSAAGSVRDGAGRSRTRSFRQSFLVSFSRRVGERLQAATDVATEDAGVVHGGAVLPVLAGRSAAVEDAFGALFPDLVQTGMRVSNRDGWVAGRVAADLAHLGPDQQLLPGIAV